MKILCLADLHGHLPRIEKCDLLILAGDICPGSHPVAQAAWLDVECRAWLAQCAARRVVAIWGNHDNIGHFTPHLIPHGLEWTLLTNTACEINGLVIYGSPWSLRFGNWAYQTDEEELERMYAHMPDETDIVIAHTPPLGVLDANGSERSCGSSSLLNRLQEVSPRLTVCGHIHEGRGYAETPFGLVVNAAMCGPRNRPQHGAIEVNLEEAAGV